MGSHQRGHHLAQQHHRLLRPRLNASQNQVEEAMDLLAYGYMDRSNIIRPQAVAKDPLDLQEDLALALALSQSMMIPNVVAAAEQGTRVENMGNAAKGNTEESKSDDTSTSCANDFAIAMALSAMDGASSCLADLESIQLDEEDTNTSCCTNYDAGGMILVDADDEWSCVIHGDLQEILSDPVVKEGPEATDRWSIVSNDHECVVPPPSEKKDSQRTASYKEVLECCFVRSMESPAAKGPPRLETRTSNIKASKTFVRSLMDHDVTLRPEEDDDPFVDWDHFKNGHGGKASLRFKGNQRKEGSPWLKAREVGKALRNSFGTASGQGI